LKGKSEYTKAYYILLVAVIILLIYILIPKVKEYYSTDKILFPVFILSMTSLGLYSFTTFNITRTVWDSRINPILTTLFIIVIIYILWNERENIKKAIKILREL
jgi:glycerol-3-phosphate acyltransferase PlsY